MTAECTRWQSSVYGEESRLQRRVRTAGQTPADPESATINPVGEQNRVFLLSITRSLLFSCP